MLRPQHTVSMSHASTSSTPVIFQVGMLQLASTSITHSPYVDHPTPAMPKTSPRNRWKWHFVRMAIAKKRSNQGFATKASKKWRPGSKVHSLNIGGDMSTLNLEVLHRKIDIYIYRIDGSWMIMELPMSWLQIPKRICMPCGDVPMKSNSAHVA